MDMWGSSLFYVYPKDTRFSFRTVRISSATGKQVHREVTIKKHIVTNVWASEFISDHALSVFVSALSGQCYQSTVSRSSNVTLWRYH